MSQQITYKEVAEHNSKKDLYMVIHDKVYNVSSFVDEHPGGEEVLLDVGGQDASEAFEDVGHSDEARELLDGMIVGTLKRVDGDPAPSKGATQRLDVKPNLGNDTGSGIGLYVVILIGGLLAYGGYIYMQNNQQK